MGKHIDVTDAEIEKLTSMCAVVVTGMCAAIVAHGLPCTAEVREAISKSITVSLTDAFLSGRLPLIKFN